MACLNNDRQKGSRIVFITFWFATLRTKIVLHREIKERIREKKYKVILQMHMLHCYYCYCWSLHKTWIQRELLKGFEIRKKGTRRRRSTNRNLCSIKYENCHRGVNFIEHRQGLICSQLRSIFQCIRLELPSIPYLLSFLWHFLDFSISSCPSSSLIWILMRSFWSSNEKASSD